MDGEVLGPDRWRPTAQGGLELSNVPSSFRLDLETRKRLGRLAQETGGRSFFPEAAADLQGVYAAIQAELRARYLLVSELAMARNCEESKVEEILTTALAKCKLRFPEASEFQA